MRIYKLVLLFFVTQLLFVTTAFAEKQPDETMQKLIAAGTPGAAHKQYEPLVGRWKTSSIWKMAPEAEAETSTGSAKREWVLNGLFVKEKYDDPNGKTPFTGIGMWGYDNVMKQYQSTWVDSMSSTTWRGTGKFDPTSRKFSFISEGSCPLTGEKIQTRGELTILSNNKHTFESYAKTPEGKEFKSVEIVYQRMQS